MVTDRELLEIFEPMYAGDKDAGNIRCYSSKVVRTRAAHDCPGNFSGQLHPIKVGSRAVFEHALIDGKWRTCYTCEGCISKFAEQYGALRDCEEGRG